MEDVLDYEGLIYSIINKYTSRYDKDDLYQVGMIGLMDAYKHYDSSYDTKFSSFAYYYILGEVNKFIRNSSSLKISKSVIELKSRILKVKESMTQKLGRTPTNLEISLYLEVPVELIDEALLTDEVESIDEEYNMIPSFDDTSAEVLDLKEELRKLPEEERKLIIARYFEEMTQQETSQLLGMSQVQVSRNESKILKKLRTRL
ncbi:MAG: sigma-70 family RNA polymerase sigma factor [Bacilli bacterium]|nr:sigma-70 family RNA polymerase sigma factor [Bacilli bacterium]